MSANCQYSIRLISRLKKLDQGHQIDFDLVGKAIDWAKKYHGNQKRKSGEPYYTHPLEVAYMVAEYLLKTDVIVAAILHDIIEDTEVTLDMILDNFSERIMEMVDYLTCNRTDDSILSVQMTLEHLLLQDDRETLVIKLFDRIHNLQTLSIMSINKQKGAIVETLQNFILVAMHLNDIELEKLLIKQINLILPPEQRYKYPSYFYDRLRSHLPILEQDMKLSFLIHEQTDKDD